MLDYNDAHGILGLENVITHHQIRTINPGFVYTQRKISQMAVSLPNGSILRKFGNAVLAVQPPARKSLSDLLKLHRNCFAVKDDDWTSQHRFARSELVGDGSWLLMNIPPTTPGDITCNLTVVELYWLITSRRLATKEWVLKPGVRIFTSSRLDDGSPVIVEVSRDHPVIIMGRHWVRPKTVGHLPMRRL